MFNPSFAGFVYRTRPRPAFTSGNLLVDAAFRNAVAPPAPDGITEVDYHRDVQEMVVASLRSVGNIVEEDVRLTMVATPGTTWNYDADALMKASCDTTVNIIEVKTSTEKRNYDEFDGSEFRRKQFQVIIAANKGGLVYSTYARITVLGLVPGAILPAMGILLMHALPGQVLRPKYIEPGDVAAALEAAR